MLVSVTPCSEPLYSALLCSVHGYARVHTSIIYIWQLPVCFGSTNLRFKTRWQREGSTPNLGSVGAERQPGGPCWCPVGASRRRAGPQILSHRFLFGNCAWPGPVRLLRRAGPGHGQPAWRTGGTVVSGRAEIIGVSRRRNARFFWASRFGRGPDSKKSPFRSIVEKTVPGWTGGLKGAGGCSSECCSVVGRVDERLAVEAEGHYI